MQSDLSENDGKALSWLVHLTIIEDNAIIFKSSSVCYVMYTFLLLLVVLINIFDLI